MAQLVGHVVHHTPYRRRIGRRTEVRVPQQDALTGERLGRRRVAVDLLYNYVGHYAGERIYSGQITRGALETIDASGSALPGASHPASTTARVAMARGAMARRMSPI